MSQIIKKFIANDAVDETKIKLSNNQAVRARNAANSADIDILKLDASDVVQVTGALNASGSVTGSNLSGTNTGNVTLNNVGSSPDAKGATISGQAITLQPFDSTHPGVVPQSGGGTTNFLRADGTWAAPSGGGGGATTALDNLASVAINASLVPDTDITYDLGSSPLRWYDAYFENVKDSYGQIVLNATNHSLYDGSSNNVLDFSALGILKTANSNFVFDAGANALIKTKDDSAATQGISLKSGNSSSDGSGAVQILSGSADDVDSGSITIQTGDAATAISGNIVIQVGNQSAAGSRGNIIMHAEGISMSSGDGITPTLVVINNGALAISEPNDIYRTTIQPDPGLAASYTLTLPADAGSSGEVLSTDGTGVLSWIPAGSTAPTNEKELFVLSGTNITNQYIDLAQVALTDSIDFLVKGGGVMIEGASYDYSVSYTGGAGGKTRITFLNDLATGGGAALVATDVVVVKYQY